MTARILSIASAFPPLAADVEEATGYAVRMSSENAEQAKMIGKLYRRTGIQTRGSVLLEKQPDGRNGQSFYPVLDGPRPNGPTMHQRNERFAIEAPRLGTRASKSALQQANVLPSQITHVVTISCTGFSAPGLDIELIQRLGLPATTQRVAVGFMGCHGLINGLRTARGLVAAEHNARVLVVSVELCSLHYQYGYDAQRIVSGAIFADGAAAMVIVGEEHHGGQSLGQITATGSCLIPDSADAMTWRIGDHGFMMTLESCVPHLIETHLPDYLHGWLSQNGYDVDSIGGWAVHPGGNRILQAVETSMQLPEGALAVSREVLRDHGNMSSATLGAVLRKFVVRNTPKPWLMLGFGPGLETEVALIQ